MIKPQFILGFWKVIFGGFQQTLLVTITTAVTGLTPPPLNRTMRALAAVNTEGNLSVAEPLSRANPTISLEDARRMYPSIPLDGSGTGAGRVVLVDDVNRGLPARMQIGQFLHHGFWKIQKYST